MEFVPSNNFTAAVSDLSTFTGGVATYIANYPVGRQCFEDTIFNTLKSIDSEDKSIVLYRYDKSVKAHEQFECKKWNRNYIFKYNEIDNLTFNRTNVLRLTFNKFE